MPQIKSGGGLLFYLYLSQKIIYRAQPLPHRLGRTGAHCDKKPRKREVPGLLKEFISNSFYSAVSNSFWNFSIDTSLWLRVTDSLIAV